jgi:hypothetical protein
MAPWLSLLCFVPLVLSLPTNENILEKYNSFAQIKDQPYGLTEGAANFVNDMNQKVYICIQYDPCTASNSPTPTSSLTPSVSPSLTSTVTPSVTPSVSTTPTPSITLITQISTIWQNFQSGYTPTLTMKVGYSAQPLQYWVNQITNLNQHTLIPQSLNTIFCNFNWGQIFNPTYVTVNSYINNQIVNIATPTLSTTASITGFSCNVYNTIGSVSLNFYTSTSNYYSIVPGSSLTPGSNALLCTLMATLIDKQYVSDVTITKGQLFWCAGCNSANWQSLMYGGSPDSLSGLCTP